MTFIRVKEIPPNSGNFYEYEVEAVREGYQVKQKHLRYLGLSKTKQTILNAEESKELRNHVFERDNGLCWICGKPVDYNDFDLGHIVDRCNGGLIVHYNIAPMHRMCNIKKPKHKTLEEAYKWRDKQNKGNKNTITDLPLFSNINKPKNQLTLL